MRTGVGFTSYWASVTVLIGLMLAMFVLLWGQLACAQGWGVPESSNPPEIRLWFQQLTNRMGGSCCGEGDAYPAVITKMPSPKDDQGRESYRLDGEVCVTDPSGKEIVIQGIPLKRIPTLTGELCHKFSWMKMTREIYGNPFDHALVFVRRALFGDTNAIDDIYCVVALPQVY